MVDKQDAALAEIKAQLDELLSRDFVTMPELMEIDRLQSIIARVEAGQPLLQAKLSTQPGDMMTGETEKAIKAFQNMRGGDGAN